MSQNGDKNRPSKPQTPAQTPTRDNYGQRGTTPEPKFHIPIPAPQKKKGN